MRLLFALGTCLLASLTLQAQTWTRTDVPLPEGPLDLVVADLDGNGVPVIAVSTLSDSHPSPVYFLRRQSVAPLTFAVSQSDPIGIHTEGIAAGDLDGDGLVDVVVANTGQGTITILRNTIVGGAHILKPALTLSPASTPHRFKIVDMDGDGVPDIVVTANSDRAVYILRNVSTPGHLAFEPALRYGTPAFLNNIAVADFDGDGRLDFAVPLQDTDRICVARNLSTPSSLQFDSCLFIDTPGGPEGITTADFDGDGKVDVAIATVRANGFSAWRNVSTPGTIAFDTAARFDLPVGGTASIVNSGTLDPGGKVDAIINAGNGAGDYDVKVIRNHSQPGSLDFAISDTLPQGIFPMAIADIDGDGRGEILVADNDRFRVSVWRRQGNAPPVVGSITATATPQPVGAAISVTAPFTDADAGDSHVATVAWGDGTTSAASVSEANGAGTAGATHAYSAAGVYTITVTVTDSHGASGSAAYQYAVIYDADAGFVTGGGWINSPAGAATFGFVSRYAKGTTVPAGNTEFRTATLNFHSTSYEWLVISGTRAQYKGSGSVNGSDDYGFLLTAIDGAPDKLRIKIWDKGSGAVIYDNMTGSADSADPATVLGGGDIIIHR